MKIVKLRNGKYKARAYAGRDEDGKVQLVTVYGDTRKECAKNAMSVDQPRYKMSVSDAIRKYIELKESVLSPSTVRGYYVILKTHILRHSIAKQDIHALNSRIVQAFVSTLAVRSSPKTVKNVYGLLAATVNLYAPEVILDVRLPQNRKPKLYTPTTADVLKVIEYIKVRNQSVYIGALLASVGMMRCGEISALEADDIDRERCTVTINKSQCRTKDGEMVTKPPKTDASNRVIVLPQFVIDAIPEREKPCKLSAPLLSRQFGRYVRRAGVPVFRLHDLRHYAASIAASSAVGISTETIKARGGWSSDSVMKRVYINQIGDITDSDTQLLNSYYSDHFTKQ